MIKALAIPIFFLYATVAVYAQGGYLRVQSAHIVLMVPRNVEAAKLLNELEAAYKDVRNYGLKLPSQVEAVSYASTTDFVKGSGGARFNLAMASGRTMHLQPYTVLLHNTGYLRALRHELTHVALYDAARRGLPRWLNEGMAMMVAGETFPITKRYKTIAQLERTLTTSRSQTAQRSAYAVCHRLCSLLTSQYGKDKLTGMLRATATGNFGTAFRALTGTGADEWAAKAMERTDP